MEDIHFLPIGEHIFAKDIHIAMFKQTGDALTALAFDNDRAMNILWVEGAGNWQVPAQIWS